MAAPAICRRNDADNDTLLDLAVTNGWREGIAMSDPSKLFRNLGGTPPMFGDISASSGFDDTYWGSALAAVDHDRDGDLDLVQTTQTVGSTSSSIRLLEHQGAPASNNYLVVRPRMSGANHRAIGAVVRATVGDIEMMRPITAGTSFFSQEPAEAFFGLGAAAVVDRVVVEWPGGLETEVLDVAANRVLTISTDTDTDGDGLHDAVDDDDDNDGVPDSADCFDTNGQMWSVPGEVRDLILTQTADTNLSWMIPAAPGGTWVPYDTIVSSNPGDFIGGAACLESKDGTDTTASDPAEPPVGEARYYLTRVVSSCGAGSAGVDSSGTPRAVRNCP